jgi:hypothetical protein
LWVLACLPDLASDFSVFHRVTDMTVLHAASFFALATRLAAYSGCMTAAVRNAAAEAAADEDAPGLQDGPPERWNQGGRVQPALHPAGRDGPVEMVGATRAELERNPVFREAGLFSFGGG